MPNTINITNIPAPRVDVIDSRTGLMSAVWYRFFYNMFILTGNGTNQTSLEDLQVGPLNNNEIIIDVEGPNVNTQALVSSLDSQIAELTKQVEGLQSQPSLTSADIIAYISGLSTAPVTKTADFTVNINETWIINNKVGSTCTVTLPAAAAYVGRVLTFQNYQDQLLVSASSDVVPIGGGAASTSILEDVSGNSATLVSDGTNWVIMQRIPNNVLLI
jgi:hypothetical protein